MERTTELGLKPYVVRDVAQVVDKEQCLHSDTVLVDSLVVVCSFHFSY